MQLRGRLGAEYRPIALRALVLGLCGLLAWITAVKANPATSEIPSPELIPSLMAALLLLMAGTLGTLPLPSAVPNWVQPLGETVAASLVIAFFPRSAGVYFLTYLLVPLTTAGLTAGFAAAMSCASVSWLVFGAQLTLQAGSHQKSAFEPALWLPLLGAAAAVSGWARRVMLQQGQGVAVDPAYANAHRLLSELNSVARQLSLGLDPQTLATALVQEVQTLIPGVRATVLVRADGSRLVPLVGDSPSPLAESVVQDAWVAADLVRRGRSGAVVVALPVLMGERVVAVVVMTGDAQRHDLSDDALKACRTAVAAAGPRLASAMLFDDVRRLATVDERHRLAREIHDGIAQDMASVGYLLDDIAAGADEATGSRLHSLRLHLSGLVDELRLSIFDLRAGVDESLGLAQTLGDHVTRVGTKAGLIVHVSTDDSPHRLPIATEVELLRIVQEAVTNVRRHASANNLWLTVVIDPPRAHVVVADDGKGLGMPRPDSVGITGMQERARRIGAELSISNRSQGGVKVELLLEPGHARAADRKTAPASEPASNSTGTTALAGRRSGGGPS